MAAVALGISIDHILNIHKAKERMAFSPRQNLTGDLGPSSSNQGLVRNFIMADGQLNLTTHLVNDELGW
jgi:hypothetical protein